MSRTKINIMTKIIIFPAALITPLRVLCARNINVIPANRIGSPNHRIYKLIPKNIFSNLDGMILVVYNHKKRPIELIIPLIVVPIIPRKRKFEFLFILFEPLSSFCSVICLPTIYNILFNIYVTNFELLQRLEYDICYLVLLLLIFDFVIFNIKDIFKELKNFPAE